MLSITGFSLGSQHRVSVEGFFEMRFVLRVSATGTGYAVPLSSLFGSLFSNAWTESQQQRFVGSCFLLCRRTALY